MEARIRQATAETRAIMLPGSSRYYYTNEGASAWIDKHVNLVSESLEELNEAQLGRALMGIHQGWGRVNEILAQEYAIETHDRLKWELRYLRWMANIRSIVFASDKWGEFTMYRVCPQNDPGGQWVTVDWAVDSLGVNVDVTRRMINEFNTFPVMRWFGRKPEKMEMVDTYHIDHDGFKVTSEYGK